MENNELTNKKILIVDDNADNSFSLELLLSDSGYDCICVSSGEMALEQLAANKFDILLTDVRMPGMSGFELIKAIKANRKIVDLPIITVTAQAMSGDKEKCIEAGADEYVAKPVEPDELLQKIQIFL